MSGLDGFTLTQVGEPLPGTLECWRDARRCVTVLVVHLEGGPTLELGDVADRVQVTGDEVVIDWRAIRAALAEVER